MDIQEGKGKVAGGTGWDFGSLLAIGISFGFIVGLLLENTGMGLSLGLGVAVFLNAIREKRQRAKGSTIALAISIGALLAVGALWIWVI